jgi:co-chaperonin GroES (HSP10)
MIKPLHQQVVVRPFPSDEVSDGGIFVPENCRTRNNKATVVSVGSGSDKRPMRFKPGMIIHNIKDSGMPIVIDEVTHYVIDQSYILATEN